jgi:hypothetical protein
LKKYVAPQMSALELKIEISNCFSNLRLEVLRLACKEPETTVNNLDEIFSAPARACEDRVRHLLNLNSQ